MRAKQLELPGVASPPARPHKLFFAVQPPTDIAESIVAIGRILRAQHGLVRHAFPSRQLHVTLASLGSHAHYPTEIFTAAEVAGTKVLRRRFVATFDQAMTFGRSKSPSPLPYVLTTRHPANFIGLKHAIELPFGIRRNAAFAPHMTLQYDEKIVRPTRLEPISWEVDEFVLIYARPRQAYQIVGRWKLT